MFVVFLLHFFHAGELKVHIVLDMENDKASVYD